MLLARFQLREPKRPDERACPSLVLVLLALMTCMASFVSINAAYAETRTLKMYFTHTRESATITFKRNGKYDRSGLKKLNRFLRDWRRKEPTRMDPQLFDLVWEVYQRSGSRKPIHVISGYRSPRTNNMLRRRGRGVAKSSQHTKGKALDFFLPDVGVDKLRALGLKAHRGGVGYYRGSFVHLDTGRVRHWPRMSRRQLSRVFPKGRTIHVPSNGKRLKGYNVALANLKRGLNSDGSSRKTRVQKNLIARIFKPSGSTEKDIETVASARASAPKPKPAKAAPKPVAVAAKAPEPPKRTGPDPFAREVAASRGNEQNEQSVSTVLASLNVSQLAVPKRRPDTAVESQVAELSVPGADTPASIAPDTITPETIAPETIATVAEPLPQIPVSPPPQLNEATVLAALQRPAVNLPVPVQKASLSGDDVAQLNERIRSSLVRRQQLSAAANAAEQQANVQLATALGSVSVPKPANRALLLQPDRVETQGPSVGSSGTATPMLDSARLANSQQAKELVQKTMAALAPKRLAVPSRRQLAITNELTLAKPVRRPARPAQKSDLLAGEYASANMTSELELGDLESRLVKLWAVAASTRIGPLAQLTAPRYSQGTRRLAPTAVFSAGFADERSPLRADRFSGRSLKRVAFASLRSLN